MNTQKSVYNRLFSKVEKTELESQKVELALIDNFKKHESAIKKIVEKSQKQKEKLNNTFDQVKTQNNQLIKDGLAELDKAYDELKKVSKIANDLGIQVPSEFETIMSKMEKQVNKDIEVPSINSIPYK
jgi:lipopolysaccharide biosynthesis regulator YciM